MDGVFSALVGAAPQLGGASVLIFVLGLLIQREIQTSKRHGAELERLGNAHEKELIAQRESIAALREQVGELNGLLDTERRAKWRAEDVAAKHRRQGPDGGRHTWQDQ